MSNGVQYILYAASIALFVLHLTDNTNTKRTNEEQEKNKGAEAPVDSLEDFPLTNDRSIAYGFYYHSLPTKFQERLEEYLHDFCESRGHNCLSYQSCGHEKTYL